MPTLLQEKWSRVMDSVITAAWYRIFGQSSVHADFTEITQFVMDEIASPTRWGGYIEWLFEPYVFEWKGIRLGEGLTTDLIFWGAPGRTNTVITRRGFWRMYLGRATVENVLGLPRGTFLTRFDIGLPGA